MLSWKQQDNARGLSTENIQKLRLKSESTAAFLNFFVALSIIYQQ